MTLLAWRLLIRFEDLADDRQERLYLRSRSRKMRYVLGSNHAEKFSYRLLILPEKTRYTHVETPEPTTKCDALVAHAIK